MSSDTDTFIALATAVAIIAAFFTGRLYEARRLVDAAERDLTNGD